MNSVIETLLDRLVRVIQERQRLESRIDEIQRQLQPPKSVVKINKRKLYLN